MASAARAATALAAVAALALPGCLHRKMILRSDPEGAVVLLDGQPVEGKTPLEQEFIFPGRRRVTLMVPDYEVLDTTVEIEERWYDYFLLDFFAEFLWPGDIEDVQTFDLKMTPYFPRNQPLGAEQKAEIARRIDGLLERGERYRAGGSDGPVDALPVPEEVPPGSEKVEPPPPPPR